MDSLNSKTSNLIDAYVKGKLSGAARRDFEQNFMKNPDIAEEVKFRKGIIQEFNRQEEMSQFESLLKKVENEISEEEQQATSNKQRQTQTKPKTKTSQLKYGTAIYRYASVAAISLLFLSTSLLGYGFKQKQDEASKLSNRITKMEAQSENFSLLKIENKTLKERKDELKKNITFLENSLVHTQEASRLFENKLSFQKSNVNTLEEQIKVLQRNIGQLELSNKELTIEKERLVIQVQEYQNNNNPTLAILADDYLDIKIPDAYASTSRTTRSSDKKNKDNLMAMEAFKNKNYQQALEHFISSSKNTPDPPSPITEYYIGLCYLSPSINQVDKAIINLEFVKQQKNSTINFARWHLALAYLKTNRLEIAKKNLYEIVVNLDDFREDENRINALKLLLEIERA